MTVTRIVENKNTVQVLREEDVDAKTLVAMFIVPDKQSPLAALQVTATVLHEDGDKPLVTLTLFSRNSSQAGVQRLSDAIPDAVVNRHANESLDEPNISYPSNDRTTAFVKDSGALTYTGDGVKTIDLYPLLPKHGVENPPFTAALDDLHKAGLITDKIKKDAGTFIAAAVTTDLIHKGPAEQKQICRDIVSQQHDIGKGAKAGRG